MLSVTVSITTPLVSEFMVLLFGPLTFPLDHWYWNGGTPPDACATKFCITWCVVQLKSVCVVMFIVIGAGLISAN